MRRRSQSVLEGDGDQGADGLPFHGAGSEPHGGGKGEPQADVWFGAPNENHIIAKNKGLTQPHVSKNASAIDANFRDPQGYWTAFYMNPLGVGVLADELINGA